MCAKIIRLVEFARIKNAAGIIQPDHVLGNVSSNRTILAVENAVIVDNQAVKTCPDECNVCDGLAARALLQKVELRTISCAADT